jgi:hypothetical protein
LKFSYVFNAPIPHVLLVHSPIKMEAHLFAEEHKRVIGQVEKGPRRSLTSIEVPRNQFLGDYNLVGMELRFFMKDPSNRTS